MYQILISTLEHIRYLMSSSPDFGNIPDVIFSCDDIVSKYCAASTVTDNSMCTMRSFGVLSWIILYKLDHLLRLPFI